MAELVVVIDGTVRQSYPLGESWVTIGRADENIFQINEISVSSRHCEVKLKGDELLVRDLMSTNGTFIEEKKISEGVLKLGQALRLGEVELRLYIPAPGTGTPPAPAEAKASELRNGKSEGIPAESDQR